MKTNRIPIVVGVTGHRDLRESDLLPLTEKVRRVLTDLRAKYPASPLVLLSSLAEGADRLAAHVALAYGFELLAPLPLPLETYRKDFHTEASQREFTELLGQATASFVLPFSEGVTPQNVDEDSPRERQYALAGEYILRHCHVLLALWDGRESGKKGGTSQVVRQKLSGYPVTVRPEWAVLKPPDSGAVFHVLTPRESHPQVENAYRLEEYHTDSRFFRTREDAQTAERNGREIFASLLEQTNAFNEDLARIEPSLEASPAGSGSALEAGSSAFDGDLQVLRNQFAAADLLASHYQKKRRLSLLLLCILALESPVCLAAYHSSAPDHPGNGLLCLLGFFAGAGSALLVYLIAKRGRYETKHLDYRALAEGLKVLFFWRVAGIHDDVGAQYLRKQRSEVDWIRLAVRAADLLTSLRTAPAESYAWIKIQWMEHQLHYFEKSATACGKKEESCGRWTRVLVMVSVALAGLMLAVQLLCYGQHRPLPPEVSRAFHGLSVLIVGLLAAGGSFAAYAEKLAFSQQAKQYKQMRSLFSLAVRECGECLERGETDPVRTVIRRLGQEALRENGDWVLLHRERPMELRIA
jgi:hypothetical protein